jgi:peptide-methionine (R)-S-oxide reductase
MEKIELNTTCSELRAFRFVKQNIPKMKLVFFLSGLILALLCLQACNRSQANSKQTSMDTNNKTSNPVYSRTDTSPVNVTDDQWKNILPKNVYDIARQKGTERPYSSPLEENHEVGTYYCAVCGNPLFKSDTKFESGCGWPSFYEPISKSSIIYLPDHAHGMERTEVECGRCKSHLGHVFHDGPPPTGLRYCINGVVLDFEKAKDVEKKYNAEHGK